MSGYKISTSRYDCFQIIKHTVSPAVFRPLKCIDVVNLNQNGFIF